MSSTPQLTEFDAPTFVGATAETSIAVTTFDHVYRARPPWDIDGPQPDFARLLDAELICGRVLDIGCGTGENAMYFAHRGLDVTGLDASAAAIERANEKASRRRIPVRFICGDALRLGELGETFDTVTDCGLLHVLSDAQMVRLIAGVRAVLRPGGRLWLMCFSEHSTGNGPRKLTAQRIRSQFARGWEVESLAPARFHTVPGRYVDQPLTAAWLVAVKRV
jgi:SAM-dependent methyltransferase